MTSDFLNHTQKQMENNDFSRFLWLVWDQDGAHQRQVGTNLGELGPQIGASGLKVGASWAEVGAKLAQVGAKMAPMRPNLDQVVAKLT